MTKKETTKFVVQIIVSIASADSIGINVPLVSETNVPPSTE
jgi:hypothetical protein